MPAMAAIHLKKELDVRHTHQGVYSAWLTKVKHNGAKVKWIQSSCRRYFTIDFESQIVFYSHSETDKRISLPILFRDILCASMVTSPAPKQAHFAPGCEPAGHPGQAMGRSRSGSWLARPSTRDLGEFPLVLQTRDRRIRLVADCEAEALSWVEMLNAAHRIGKGDGPAELAPEPAPKTVSRETVRAAGKRPPKQTDVLTEPDSPTVEAGTPLERSSPTQSPRSEAEPDSPALLASSATAADVHSRTPSPTDTGSNATMTIESRSTTEGEGSESTEVSSPTAWSDGEAISSGAAPASPRAAAATLAQQATARDELASDAHAAYRTSEVPAGLTRSPRRATWHAAAEAAKAPVSSNSRTSLTVADFGFDDREEFEEEANSRASSPDSVTISPRLREGLPTVVLEQPPQIAAEMEASREEEDNLFDDPEDSDSDCEVTCEVRDQRIEQDLELMRQMQQRSSRLARPNKECLVKADSRAPDLASKPESGDEAEKSARIAADLRLLQKPGGASSAAVAASTVPAPLRRRTQLDAEADIDEDKARRRAARKAAKMATRLDTEADIDEDKERRRAARKAAKEAAKQAAVQEAGHEVVDAESREAQISAEEAKARRRAARKAAKEAAAKGLENQEMPIRIGETAGAIGSWVAGM